MMISWLPSIFCICGEFGIVVISIKYKFAVLDFLSRFPLDSSIYVVKIRYIGRPQTLCSFPIFISYSIAWLQPANIVEQSKT